MHCSLLQRHHLLVPLLLVRVNDGRSALGRLRQLLEHTLLPNDGGIWKHDRPVPSFPRALPMLSHLLSSRLKF